MAEPNFKEEITMNEHANKCIECTVQSCAYHCDKENYCSLDRILVCRDLGNRQSEESSH